ncbi:hypothetical protein RIF29_03963 [Crotalaria pallida]|uniref:Uncharacterized protein n=1 Tax=Crotalaria pallida TaxID=3830 RepID=A0AAN9PA53_CROPI
MEHRWENNKERIPVKPLGSSFLGAVGSWFFWFFLIINVSHDKMDKFVEDPVVNLDDDNSASDESGGEEHDGLGDKNGPAEVNESGYQYKRITDLTTHDIWDLEFGSEEAAYKFYSMYARSIGFYVRKEAISRDSAGNRNRQDSDFNKVARLGAVAAAHSRLGEIAASKRDLFKDICDDLFKLVNKYENLAGAPRKRKDSKKRRRCSHCNSVGHTTSTCPKRLSENDQYSKDENLASSNSLATDSEHDNDKEGNQHDEDKPQPSMPKNQSKTAKDKNVKKKLSQNSKRKGNKVKCSTQSSLEDTGFQPNMTSGGSMPAFVQGIHPYPSLSGVRPEILQGVYGFPHYGHGVASQGLSPFLPYVGYPFFNQNLHHYPVYQQFPHYLNGGEKANSSQSFHGLLQEVIKRSTKQQ